jgi:hypothetical protein
MPPLLKRDERDPNHRERLAGAYGGSIVLHAIAAALLFAVVANSSQEGATESQIGGDVVTIERRSPVQIPQPSVPEQAQPVPHAPVIAPIRHAPIPNPATQSVPQARPELSKIVAKAPPQPRPLPQSTPQPNPQPTQAPFEPKPATDVAAVPVSVPTAAAAAITVKIPPTAAPSPAPSAIPTAHPVPRPPAPTARPSAKPATPAPPGPTTAPTAPAVIARASARPSAAPASPGPVASAPPAVHHGVPSPSPTSGAPATKSAGTAPSPGPSGHSSPGPRAGNSALSKPGPSKPVTLRPTPNPGNGNGHGQSAPDINAKLRAMLPTGPVNPQMKQYAQHPTLEGHLVPTPPPDVLAHTQYIFDERGTGDSAEVKMWVTSVRHAGPFTECTGWMLVFPESVRGGYAVQPREAPIPPSNGGSITVGGAAGGGPLGPTDAGLDPIVKGVVTTTCSARRLTPFTPPAP